MGVGFHPSNMKRIVFHGERSTGRFPLNISGNPHWMASFFLNPGMKKRKKPVEQQ